MHPNRIVLAGNWVEPVGKKMEEFGIHDIAGVLRRRRTVFFSVVGVFLLLSIAVTFTWSSYRSTATVQIQQPDIPENVTTPLGTSASEMMQALVDKI